MGKRSAASARRIDELAERHGFSREAVMILLDAIVRGNGMMAQFNHPELGGAGQWMGGGMIMLSDMFNHALKARVADLATELAKLVASDASLSAAREAVSLRIAPTAEGSHDWWPSGLGVPTSHGAQNRVRYAYFAKSRRLAIELDGRLTLYDTLDHEIAGFSQQQSRGGSLSFHSQHGLIDLADLPVVSGGR